MSDHTKNESIPQGTQAFKDVRNAWGDFNAMFIYVHCTLDVAHANYL